MAWLHVWVIVHLWINVRVTLGIYRSIVSPSALDVRFIVRSNMRVRAGGRPEPTVFTKHSAEPRNLIMNGFSCSAGFSIRKYRDLVVMYSMASSLLVLPR